MKLLVMSDLHIDSGRDVADALLSGIKSMRRDFDVLVIAGDVSNSALETAEFLRKAVYASFKDVVFVPGNHEYYNFDYSYANEILFGMNGRREYMKKLHVLNDSCAIIKVRGKEYLFVGSTLWTDFRIMGDFGRSLVTAQTAMNDFRAIIMPNDKHLTPDMTVEMNRKSVDAMKFFIKNEHERDIIAVTHHGVSWNSVAPQYQKQYLTAAFCSGFLDPQSSSYEPAFSKVKLWIHGHVHASFDYVIDHGEGDTTRVVVNPKGYEFVQNENPSFSFKIVEV